MAHQERGEQDYGVISSWNPKTDLSGSRQHIETAEIKAAPDWKFLRDTEAAQFNHPLFCSGGSVQASDGSADDELCGHQHGVNSARRGRFSEA